MIFSNMTGMTMNKIVPRRKFVHRPQRHDYEQISYNFCGALAKPSFGKDGMNAAAFCPKYSLHRHASEVAQVWVRWTPLVL